MAEMRHLTAYFNEIRPGNTWSTMEPIFTTLFHPNVIIIGNKNQFDYLGWKHIIQDLLESNIVEFQMEQLYKEGPNCIVYTVTICINNNLDHNNNDPNHHTFASNDMIVGDVEGQDAVGATSSSTSAQQRIQHTARGIFQDGQLIRTEPFDPSIYDTIARNTRKQQNDEQQQYSYKRRPVSIL